MQGTLVFLGLLALSAPLLQGAAAACQAGQFQCRDGTCTKSLADKCDGVKTCKDGSDEDTALCNGLANTQMKLEDAENASVVKVTYAAEHEGIVLLLCNKAVCSKLEITGATKDGALRYSSYEECNSLGGGPCKLNSTVSPDGAAPFPAGPVVLHVLRLPMRFAVFKEGHMNKSVVGVAPMCGAKLIIRPLVWKTDMPVTITKKKVDEYEKEGQSGSFEAMSGAQILAATIVEATTCAFKDL